MMTEHTRKINCADNTSKSERSENIFEKTEKKVRSFYFKNNEFSD